MFDVNLHNKTETVLSGLRNLNATQVIKEISNQSKNPLILDLGWNDLGNRPNQDLQDFFAAVHENTQTIDLRGNNFDKKDGTELGAAFVYLKHVTQLGLCYNSLNLQKNLATTLSELAQTKITSLDISSNDLGFAKQLPQAIAKLKGIISLNMSFNKLHQKKDDEFAELCSAFSGKLQHLNLSNNNLGNKVKHLKHLPPNITSLDISDNAIQELSTDELAELKDRFQQLTMLYLGYDDVSNMTWEQRKQLDRILLNVKTVVFLDASGKSQDKPSFLNSFARTEKERVPLLSIFKPNNSINEEYTYSSISAFKKK